ncbi:MAG: hypothetical protein EXR98_02780 [Gemmataceae bacterium]|nr:hypothetical protein [Gemmataceae bacterium]
MSKLTDPEKLACFKNALANWRYEGFIILTEVAFDWIRIHLPTLSPRSLGRLMHESVLGGNEIDQQKETRPEWSVHDFHYDLRFAIDGRLVYIETRLIYDDPDDPDNPIIHVVNIHEA